MQYPVKTFLSFLICSIIFLTGCGRKKKDKKEIQNYYSKKTETLHPVPGKKIERLTYDEALKVYTYYKRLDKKSQIAQTIERIISLANDHEVVDPLLIELADIEMEQGNYAKAEEYYAQHSFLYPGGSRIDYVKKQQIEAAFAQMLIPTRDQTKTRDTIKLVTNFTKTFPENNRFMEQVITLGQKSYLNLLEHELLQVQFYIHQYNLYTRPKALAAAWQRLLFLYRDILPSMTDTRAAALREAIKSAESLPPEQQTLAVLTPLITQVDEFVQKKQNENLPLYKSLWLTRF